MTDLTRRGFLAAAGLAAAHASLASAVPPSASGTASTASGAATLPAERGHRPNIVVILADDLGHGDLSRNGSPHIRTPHIDALASASVRFTDAYVAAPVCGPSRSALLTGRYPARIGHEFNGGPHDRLPPGELTIADRLRPAGYACGCIGKWHLGVGKGLHPLDRGFDSFFGNLAGMFDYLLRGRAESIPMMRDRDPAPENAYATDAFAREAEAFIARHARRPFFLYLAPNAPHAPPQAAPAYLQRNAHIPEGRHRTYAAMVTALDDLVGRVTARLTHLGLDRDTVVVFLSDNGGTPEVAASNGPFRGYKKDLWEGGIRVPMFVRAAGRFEPRTVHLEPVTAMDLLPTFAAWAGVGLDAPAERSPDGRDLTPLLDGRTDRSPHDTLYWRFGQQRAVRRGGWKYLRFRDEPARLYNLHEDFIEARDQARRQPELVLQLAEAMAAWEADKVANDWQYEPAPIGGSRPWPKTGKATATG